MTDTTTTTGMQGNKRPLLPRGLIDTLSGSGGGVALVLVGHPFDTLKVSGSSINNNIVNNTSNGMLCDTHTGQNAIRRW